jgi:hypothetical protein
MLFYIEVVFSKPVSLEKLQNVLRFALLQHLVLQPLQLLLLLPVFVRTFQTNDVCGQWRKKQSSCFSFFYLKKHVEKIRQQTIRNSTQHKVRKYDYKIKIIMNP